MSDLSKSAVMNIEKGEEIAGGWATIHIPEIGIYKLIAKKKRDGSFEWAHFVQRDNGARENVYRGTAKTRHELDSALLAINNALRKTYGITLLPSDYNMYTLDGQKIPDTKQ
jgi:hypothetical protein